MPEVQSSAQYLYPTHVVEAPDNSAGYLAKEYRRWQVIFDTQTIQVKRFLEGQARELAQALVEEKSQVRFMLPDQVYAPTRRANGDKEALLVPAELREHVLNRGFSLLTSQSSNSVLRKRLDECEASQNLAVAICAGLIRYATVIHIIYAMLPAGRSVNYLVSDEEFIPTIPKEDEMGSMQRFLHILNESVEIAPYIVVDEVYQQKYYGILGQLVNQGRCLARYETHEIIQGIWKRANAQELNRGLSVRLPYFDDRCLEMKSYCFQIIPAGRIMFVPAFVVIATRRERAKVAQDTSVSPSTRKNLIVELQMLEEAFSKSSSR